MTDSVEQDLLSLTQRLLQAIAQADWAVYQELCDPTLTAFEPEALGQRVEGMPFHRFYFQRASAPGQHQVTLCGPQVRVMGDVGLVTYVRLDQRLGNDGIPSTTVFEETRVWQKQAGHWKHVHFHRSQVRK
jgi:calcium/calmodulin-dependent protein kinase (CaM kinase) II